MGKMRPAYELRPNNLNDIRNMAQEARDVIDHIYLHWTAGHYGQTYDSYHINIDRDGEVYITCNGFEEYKSHTWNRNGYSVGVTLCCACDAEARNGSNAWLGYEPPTPEQIESMAQVVAILADKFGLPLDSPDYVMTHCEAAFKDGYGPGSGDPETRWDLWYLPDFFGHRGELVPGGDLLRGKAAYYQRAWGVQGD